MSNDSDIELRLQRVAGHARRGWIGDTARQLGVTTRTIQRARSGYVPDSFLKNLDDWERRQETLTQESPADAILRKTLASSSLTEDAHYLRGLADGWTKAIDEMQRRLSEEGKGIIGRIKQVQRERPELTQAARDNPPGTIGAGMLRKVRERLTEMGEIVTDDMVIFEREDHQRQVDLLVVDSVAKIAEVVFRTNPAEARRVADHEAERLFEGICRIIH